MPVPLFVTEHKPWGSNHISLIALVRRGVILTQFLHAKVPIKKSSFGSSQGWVLPVLSLEQNFRRFCLK